jgi:hypothetical protein
MAICPADAGASTNAGQLAITAATSASQNFPASIFQYHSDTHSDPVTSLVMWGTVLFFALVTATEPQRMGIAAILVGLRRPMHNLFAFWVGLMISSFAFAMVGMYLLRDLLVPFTQFLKSAAKSPVVPPAQITLGVLALSIAVVMVARSSRRQAVPVPAPMPVLVPVGGSSGLRSDPSRSEDGMSDLEVASKRPNVLLRAIALGLGRTSWSTVLDSGSVKLAFTAGLGTSTSPVEFWGAILAIIASGAAVGTQLSAVLVFMLVGFSIVEVPLVCYLVSPARTQAVVTRLHGWLRAHHRQIFIFILCVGGTMLISGGVSAA